MSVIGGLRDGDGDAEAKQNEATHKSIWHMQQSLSLSYLIYLPS